MWIPVFLSNVFGGRITTFKLSLKVYRRNAFKQENQGLQLRSSVNLTTRQVKLLCVVLFQQASKQLYFKEVTSDVQAWKTYLRMFFLSLVLFLIYFQKSVFFSCSFVVHTLFRKFTLICLVSIVDVFILCCK